MKKSIIGIFIFILSFNIYSEEMNNKLKSGGKLSISNIEENEPLSILNTDDYFKRHEIYFLINEYYQDFKIKGEVYIDIYAISEDDRIKVKSIQNYLNKTYYTKSQNLYFDPFEIARKHPYYNESRFLQFCAVAQNVPETGEVSSYDELYFYIDTAYRYSSNGLDFSTDITNKKVKSCIDFHAYSSKFLDEDSLVQITQGEEFNVIEDTEYIYCNGRDLFPEHKVKNFNNEILYIPSFCVYEEIANNKLVSVGITEDIINTSTGGSSEDDTIQRSLLILIDQNNLENILHFPLTSNREMFWGNIEIIDIKLTNNECIISFKRSSGILYVTMEPYEEMFEKRFSFETFDEFVNKLIENLIK